MSEFLVKHFALVALLFAGSLLIKKRSAAFRHSYWLVGFASVALLPLIFAYGGKVPVVTHPITPMTVSQLSLGKPATSFATEQRVGVSVAESHRQSSHSYESSASVPPSAVSAPSLTTFPWVSVLKGVYFLGLAVGLGRLAFELSRLRQIFQSSYAAPKELKQSIEAAASKIGLSSSPWLVVSEAISVPMTFGLIRPILAIPPAGASSAVLLHECAHIRRKDWASLVLARALCVVFWIDPLLRVAEQNLRDASELAADNSVLLSGVQATAYADELVNLAALARQSRYQPGLAVVGSTGLKSRVKEILSLVPRQSRLPLTVVLSTILLGLLTVLAVATVHFVAHPIQTASNCFIDLGNGKYIRVVAITRLDGKKADSWNVRGERLPFPVGPMREQLDTFRSGEGTKPGPDTFLILGSNADGLGGLSVGSDYINLKADQLGVEFYSKDVPERQTPRLVTGESLVCFPLNLGSGNRASAFLRFNTHVNGRSAGLGLSTGVEEYLLTDLPTCDSRSALTSEDATPGLDIREAKNNQYRFGDGRVLKLLWIGNSGSDPVPSWTPNGGRNMGGSTSFPGATFRNALYKGVNTATLKLICFQLSGQRVPTSSTEQPEVNAYEGIWGLDFYGTESTYSGDTDNQMQWIKALSVGDTEKSTDLILQVEDLSRRTYKQLPLSAVYSEHRFGPYKFGMSFDGKQPSEGLLLTRQNHSSFFEMKPGRVSSMQFLDQSGNVVASLAYSTDGVHDEYAMSRSQAESIRWVQETSAPFTYVRFRNIALQPSFGSARK